MDKNEMCALIPETADAALIFDEFDRRYLTGFASSDGCVLITKKRSVFFTDSRYLEAARDTVKNMDVMDSAKLYESAAKLLKLDGAVKVAIEQEKLTLGEFQRLKDKEELSFVTFIADGKLDELIKKRRAVKTEDEVASCIKAQRIAEKSLLRLLDFIEPGKTERELGLFLDYDMLSNGAEALSFETIVASGENGSKPHAVPGSRKVQKGDFITFDFGAVWGGYHSDMTRTVALGKVSDEQRKVYDIVLEAQSAATEKMAPGVSCRDADKAARDVITKAGYGEYFGHGTGHGVGLEIHEFPNVSPKSDTILQEGYIVTSEPGIYIPGRFGVRTEDMVLITADGSKSLALAEHSLVTL